MDERDHVVTVRVVDDPDGAKHQPCSLRFALWFSGSLVLWFSGSLFPFSLPLGRTRSHRSAIHGRSDRAAAAAAVAMPYRGRDGRPQCGKIRKNSSLTLGWADGEEPHGISLGGDVPDASLPKTTPARAGWRTLDPPFGIIRRRLWLWLWPLPIAPYLSRAGWGEERGKVYEYSYVRRLRPSSPHASIS